MCGEQILLPFHPPELVGSPPRVRGTVETGTYIVTGTGITPACAGNSGDTVVVAMVNTDHPRVCGEQVYRVRVSQISIGSPPRVRGTEIHPFPAQAGPGITPACAGNRSARSTRAVYYGDHPRVCGEQNSHSLSGLVIKGSPPRVRGTACAERSPNKAKRITPACAGNSRQIKIAMDGQGDHPRVCGEQYVISRFFGFAPGSPPRVRGTAKFGSS